MNLIRVYSRRSFFVSISILMVMTIIIDASTFYILKKNLEPSQIVSLNNQLIILFSGSLVFSIILSLFLWRFQHSNYRRIYSEISNKTSNKLQGGINNEKRKKSELMKKINQDKRIFLHLFSSLQSDGRLLDFFNEDLRVYDDAQIGTAVRNIHENCNKVIKKYLSPKPIMNQEEGDEVTIEKGFDINKVKLSGNVTGEPPFKGILQHKGWQCININLPELAQSRSPDIISPAEVEIQ